MSISDIITEDDINQLNIWTKQIIEKYRKKFDIGDDVKNIHEHKLGLSPSEVQIFIKESLIFWKNECPTTLIIDENNPITGFDILKFETGVREIKAILDKAKKLEVEIDPETIDELQSQVNKIVD